MGEPRKWMIALKYHLQLKTKDDFKGSGLEVWIRRR